MASAPSSRQSARIDLALAHIDLGFAVFSVWGTDSTGECRCPPDSKTRPKGGGPCSSPGKHPIPPKGFRAASTDPEIVKTMLSAASEPNYGLVWADHTRILIMIDVDGPDWAAKWQALNDKYGRLPASKRTKTPSGGWHLFYFWPVGYPLPEGNDFHGFVCRYPEKGYVVGPGSRINGKVYTAAGPSEIATLPPTWLPAARRPLIVVREGFSGYELPERVEVGHRHDAIRDFVASHWNHKATLAMIEAGVVGDLVPRFAEPMEMDRVLAEVRHSFETARDKFKEPAGGVSRGTAEGEEASGSMEVGLLETHQPDMPPPMRDEAFTQAAPLAFLDLHFSTRTDAAREGLLVTSLLTLSALVGHTPTVFYGSREQHASFFAMLTGSTHTGRKGTTTSLVRGAWSDAFPEVRQLHGSANSGEGLIALAAKADGASILLVEEEFARFLTAKSRDGATLSHILRQAFDDAPLSSATSMKIVSAPVHHVSMLGNVTREDVIDGIATLDIKNGFANRILWTAVTARPGHAVTDFDNSLTGSAIDELKRAVSFGRSLKRPLFGPTHSMTSEARDLIVAAGERYSSGIGLAPFLSRRLDSIAARLSLLYAICDSELVVDVPHAEAAIAITDYAYDSVRWVFPETTGNAESDLVLRHLRLAGFLNTREIEALVGKRSTIKQKVADDLQLMGYARVVERPRRDGKPGKPQRGLELI